jgi:hypothetical protein
MMLLWACFCFTTLCIGEPAVLSFKTSRNHQKYAHALRQRDANNLTKRAPFSVDLQNVPYSGGGFYYVNATVGNPPQAIALDLDTGSSDVWMFGVDVCKKDNAMCIGNGFDETVSKTATVINKDGFHLQYFTQGSNITGDYITDSFTIGKQTMNNLTMGLARKGSSASTGTMGISFDIREAIVSQGEAGAKTYPSLLDVMKQQGLISTRSFSLYLDDLAADTGSIVFGGYDKAKFKGELGILPIQPDATSNTYSSYSVILNSIGVTDSTGSTVLATSNMPAAVVLDSGSAFSLIPPELLNELIDYFGAIPDQGSDWVVRCDLKGMTGTLDFQFAGPTGPLVSVPFKELAAPIVDPKTGHSFTDSDDNPLCLLGVTAPSRPEVPLLLGDTFLRSAYVVYDMDNLQIGIAQTIFNVTDSNIEVISASAGQNLPGIIASAATTIAQTKTQAIGGTETLVTSVPTASHTAIGKPLGAAALTGYKTTYATQPTHVPGAPSSSAGGTGPGSTGAPKKADATSLLGSMGGYWKISLIVTLLMNGIFLQ